MESGDFRPDLYYRLSVFPIVLPPLRERKGDIPALVAYFIRHFASRQHVSPPRLAAGTLDLLCAYGWPGNVRELQNVIERAVILARHGEITPESLPLSAPTFAPVSPQAAASAPAPPEPREPVPFAEAERRAILDALQATGWRVSGPGGAGRLLGLKPTTLHAKMKKLGIRRPSAAGHEGGEPQDRAQSDAQNQDASVPSL
jgi:formate hydrogenlyase transcriptional activator